MARIFCSFISKITYFSFHAVRYIHEHLTLATSDEFYMDFDCPVVAGLDNDTIHDEWLLCRNAKERWTTLKDSTFALVPCTMNETALSTPTFLTRLYESLKYGAIPLILGADYVALPFSEVNDRLINPK